MKKFAVTIFYFMREPSRKPINSSVWSKTSAVHVVGNSRHRKTAGKNFTFVRDAIAVGVLQPPEIGRRRNINRTVVPDDALWENHFIREHRALVKNAIAIRVFETADAVRRIFQKFRSGKIRAGGICDIQTPAIIKTPEHGTLQQWRPGDAFDDETIWNAQRFNLSMGGGGDEEKQRQKIRQAFHRLQGGMFLVLSSSDNVLELNAPLFDGRQNFRHHFAFRLRADISFPM